MIKNQLNRLFFFVTNHMGKIMNSNIVNELSQLAKVIDDQFFNVNSGGCGVVAAQVAQHLQTLVDTRVVVYTMSKLNVDEIRSKLDNPFDSTDWEHNGMCWDHVLVEFDHDGSTYLFDSTGVVEKTPSIDAGWFKLFFSGYVTLDEILAISSQAKTWNSTFDRKQIPHIVDTIADFFKNHNPQLEPESDYLLQA